MVLGILLPESEIINAREKFATATAETLYFKLRITKNFSSQGNISNRRAFIHDQNDQSYGSIVVFRYEDADCPLGYSKLADNKIQPKLYSKWIRNCISDHRDKGSNFTYNTQKSNNSLDLIAIDVVDECLVKITTNDQYIALSYVWGGIPGLQLLVSNRTELETPGRLSLKNCPGNIPPAIRSAMILVKQMDERYLWVDRLCIEQDNQAQKHFNISHMDLIYSQALVTLLDLSSPDATEPIPGILGSSRIPVTNRWTFEYHSEYSGYTFRISLRTYPTNLEYALRRSEYEKRAWTYQERLLSPRCLYFTSHMAYHICKHGVVHCDADDLLLEEDRVDRTDNESLQTGLNPLHLGPPNRMAPSMAWQSTLAKYAALVYRYSERKLSFSEDKLNAFAGILAALVKTLPGSTVAGLPESLIDFCLLWTDAPSYGCFIERNRNFPSWSWASSNLQTGYYYGPLYIREIKSIGFSKVHYRPDPNLVSKLEDVGTSFETSFRPITSIKLHTENIQTESNLHTKLGKDVLHFNAEVCSIEHFRISPGDRKYHNAGIHTYPEGKDCGVLYPCSWTRHSIPTGCSDDKYDFVLLSEIQCPFCTSTAGSAAIYLLNNFVNTSFCSGSNCTLRHVMLIEWQGDRKWAERVGIATIHGKAWKRCKRRRMRITLK